MKRKYIDEWVDLSGVALPVGQAAPNTGYGGGHPGPNSSIVDKIYILMFAAGSGTNLQT